MNTKKLRVAAYYRMSDDDEITSIPQQQKEVREYARQQGWEIVREYEDPGKSGLLPWTKRPGFVRMLEDCQKLKDVNAVLVWHSSRFGRADSLDAAEPKLILRKLGMWLESVKEGDIDWSTPMGRMKDFMTSEQNHEYSRTLSGHVVRGANDRIRHGWRSKGVAPFGYDRLYVSPEGDRTMTVQRTERFRAPQKWGLKLIINEEEAATVRWAFERFRAGDSLAMICREINRRGIAPPYGHRPTRRSRKNIWGVTSVRDILKNRAYIGTYIVGVEHAKRTLTQLEYQERPGAIPSIVDVELFEAVQKLLAENCQRRIHRRPDNGPLNGVLFCGNCGAPLYRTHQKSGTKNPHKFTYYACGTSGEDPNASCHVWRAREDVVLPLVLEHVLGAIDTNLLRSLQAQPPRETLRERDVLEKRKKELEGDIQRGSENLLRANARTFPLLQKRLDELQGELDRITNTLVVLHAEPEDRNARIEWLRSVKGRLVKIVEAEGMGDATPHPCIPSPYEMEAIREWLGDDSGTVYVDGEPIRRDAPDGENPVTYWKYERSAFAFPAKAVLAEARNLRSLLIELGVRVSLSWTPNGKLRFKLSRAEITVPGRDTVMATFDTSVG